jgi:prepilin-type N-terminal cleavage/methylation domain-containing protein
MKKGFTMIELLMVITIMSVLVAASVPSFINFRKQAMAASVKQSLVTMRTAVKLKTQQASIACGRSPFDPGFFGNLWLALYYNDITHNSLVCTTDQIPNPDERKFFDSSQDAVYDVYGTYQTSLPRNVFANHSEPNYFALVPGHTIDLDPDGGPCGLADIYALSDIDAHWFINLDNGQIYAGTNTPGVNECNF